MKIVMNGFPNTVPIAASPPRNMASVTTLGCCLRTMSAPTVVPKIMIGASGPRTKPKSSVPNAARRIPGALEGGSSKWKPLRGPSPALPGNLWARNTTVAPRSRTAVIHHQGAWSNPKCSGNSVNRIRCPLVAISRNVKPKKLPTTPIAIERPITFGVNTTSVLVGLVMASSLFGAPNFLMPNQRSR